MLLTRSPIRSGCSFICDRQEGPSKGLKAHGFTGCGKSREIMRYRGRAALQRRVSSFENQ
jgi:hypothetical protein